MSNPIPEIGDIPVAPSHNISCDRNMIANKPWELGLLNQTDNSIISDPAIILTSFDERVAQCKALRLPHIGSCASIVATLFMPHASILYCVKYSRVWRNHGCHKVLKANREFRRVKERLRHSRIQKAWSKAEAESARIEQQQSDQHLAEQRQREREKKEKAKHEQEVQEELRKMHKGKGKHGMDEGEIGLYPE